MKMHFVIVMVITHNFFEHIFELHRFEAGSGSLTALCEKDFVTESHLYECMAQMALTHNFMWSRWNNLQNSRTMVLLVRELIEKKKTVTQQKYQTINHFIQHQ